MFGLAFLEFNLPVDKLHQRAGENNSTTTIGRCFESHYVLCTESSNCNFSAKLLDVAF